MSEYRSIKELSVNFPPQSPDTNGRKSGSNLAQVLTIVGILALLRALLLLLPLDLPEPPMMLVSFIGLLWPYLLLLGAVIIWSILSKDRERPPEDRKAP